MGAVRLCCLAHKYLLLVTILKFRICLLRMDILTFHLFVFSLMTNLKPVEMNMDFNPTTFYVVIPVMQKMI